MSTTHASSSGGGIITHVASIGHAVQDNIDGLATNLRGMGKNIRNNFDNMREVPFITQGARQQWAHQYDNSGVYKIRSIRKLLDVMERQYSYISITLLLLNTVLESLAFIIYLVVQYRVTLTSWANFDWGIECFCIEAVLSFFFALSWIGLLSVETKKLRYLCQPKSIMTYLSSFWMLAIACAAIVTQSSRWTRVYAPMFLRVWWLHECIITLLDYPQITIFFTENRLEMLRSILQCLAVIGICVGVLQMIESLSGDAVGYFNMVYIMLETFSTIGFGDVRMLTTAGRMVLIVFIFIGINYFIPMLEYIATLGVQHLRYASYGSWLKRCNHVILSGNFSSQELSIHLSNLFAGKRFYLRTQVVLLLAEQPSPDILLLLNVPMYRRSVTVLVGDAGCVKDLVRCDARGASAVFLCGGGSQSLHHSDYDVARQAIEVARHVPRVPLYALMHRSRYTRSAIPAHAHIFEFERYANTLVGLASVLPGVVPLMANLVRSFEAANTAAHLWTGNDFEDPRKGAEAVARAVRHIGLKQGGLRSYEAFYSISGRGGGGEGGASVPVGEPSWTDIYEASLAQRVVVEYLPVAQRGRSFRSLAEEFYRCGVTLLGVVQQPAEDATQTNNNNEMTTRRGRRHHAGVFLAPRGDLSGVQKIIAIADSADTVRNVLQLLPVAESEDESARITFESASCQSALRELLENRSNRGAVAGTPAAVSPNTIFSPASANNSIAFSGPIPIGNASDVVVGSPTGAVATSEPVAASTDSRDASMMAAAPAPPHEHACSSRCTRSVHVEPNAHHLSGHVVFVDLSSAHERQHWTMEAGTEAMTAKAADFFDAMRPVRQHSVCNHIVLLAQEPNYEFLSMMWEEEMVMGSLTVVQGCGLFLSDLRRLNLHTAASVVVFSAGDHCDTHGDALSVLVTRNIRDLAQAGKARDAPAIPIVVQVDQPTSVPFFGAGIPHHSHHSHQDGDWVMEPAYMSGHVVCRRMLDTCLQEAFFTPELPEVLEQLLSGWNDGLPVMALAVGKEWRNYRHVVEFCVARRLLPLGVHRRYAPSDGMGATMERYMITNPPPPFTMRDADVVYCLKTR